MGMFDYIVPECKLPITVPDGMEWQTKDTPAQFLDTYQITAGGRLVHWAYDIETVPENGRDKYGLPLFRRVNRRDEDCQFTGGITFYGCGHDASIWYALCAVFDKGKLVNMLVVEQPEKGTEDE